jgi:hypothetical protein
MTPSLPLTIPAHRPANSGAGPESAPAILKSVGSSRGTPRRSATRPTPMSRSPSLGSTTPDLAQVTEILPKIGISKRRFKQVESICLIREQRASGRQELAFNARPFVLCGLPLRRPNSNQLAYTRRNGRFSLTIVGHPEYGLPYGQDRLIPIWVATLAVRQKSRVIQFHHLTEFLRYFDLPTTGFYYKRIAAAFQRIFGSTIFFGTNERRDQNVFLDWARFHFFDQLRLWYSRDGTPDTAPDIESQNTVTLSEAFFTEIQEHAIPIERRVVAALSNAPGVLDFYTWLVWKCWATRAGTVRIPLFGCHGLGHQLGTTEYARNRSFREKMNAWLKHVKVWWPECPASISSDGLYLTVIPR